MKGFYIKELIVTGVNSKPAILTFQKGANLVTGASDTGKSYVFGALNYALGGSEPPKEILESIGYTTIYLEIITYHNEQSITLKRTIGKSKITVKYTNARLFETSNNPSVVYGTTGKVDSQDHISHFLLSLIGLSEKKLLKNREGVTQNLSFKNILKLTFVSEESIIKVDSPYYYSAQYFDRILAQSLLYLLLTGIDFTNVPQKEDKKIRETRIKGKLEFLAYQITQLALDKDNLIDEIQFGLSVYDKEYLSLDEELQTLIEEAKQLSKRKNEIFAEKQKAIEEFNYKGELFNRFNILEKQYVTDVKRLDFILEGTVLSEQLGESYCPVCSSPLDEKLTIHLLEKRDFKNAALQELNKNQIKLIGLKETIEVLQTEKRILEQTIQTFELDLQNLEINISENFSPRIQQMKSDLKQYVDYENVVSKIRFIDVQIAKLYKEKERLELLLNTRDLQPTIDINPYSLLSDLSDKIESRLQRWNYEPFVKVNFDTDYRVFDIVISGKNRRSYGKGKRSISYAASLFGLLDYCTSNDKNFSNLLVLDSPLTTFEEKRRNRESDEEQLEEVLKSFFNDFSNLPDNSQVIIFDNKMPDTTTFENIQGKVNIQVFTGSKGLDRPGFFPET